jgi:prepilin-type N-terminal cleavage/methylation domain-containing protein
LDVVALPSSFLAPVVPRHGMSLLELLVVLTLVGFAGALVAPVFRPPSLAPERNDAAIVAAARQAAIRRAEPLRLRLLANGSWSLVAQRDGALVDSGHVTGPLPSSDLLVDPLGGCVPAPQARARAFDPIACAFADEVVRP